MKQILLLLFVVSSASITLAQSHQNRVQIVSSGGAVVKGSGYGGSMSVGLPSAGISGNSGYKMKTGLYGNNKTAANPVELTVIDYDGDFDTLLVNNFQYENFEVKNTSSTDTTLTVNLTVSGGPFYLVTDTSFMLKKGESKMVSFFFMPPDDSTYTEKIVISSDGMTTPISLDVKGIGRYVAMNLSASITYPQECKINEQNIIKVTISNGSNSELFWWPSETKSLPVLSGMDTSLFKHINDTSYWYQLIYPGESREYLFGYTPRSVKDTLNALCTFPHALPWTDKMFSIVFHWDSVKFAPSHVADDASRAEHHLYPNPTAGVVNLTLPTDIGSIERITIITSDGGRIATIPFKITDSIVNLDLSDKPSGSYMLMVEGKYSVMYKVSVLK